MLMFTHLQVQFPGLQSSIHHLQAPVPFWEDSEHTEWLLLCNDDRESKSVTPLPAQSVCWLP